MAVCHETYRLLSRDMHTPQADTRLLLKASSTLQSYALWLLAQEQAKEARPGETIYKGHHSYDLMRQLQLGILFSIAKTPRAAQPDADPGGPAQPWGLQVPGYACELTRL